MGWEDNNKLGTQEGMSFGDNGEIFITSGGDDLDSFDGRYNGQGIPIARTGGVHYDSKWNSDKESINANYKIGSLTVDGTRSSLSRNTFTDQNGNPIIIDNQDDQTSHNYMFRQKADALYQLKIDSTSNLKLTIDGTLKNSDTRSTDLSSSYKNGNIVNNQDKKLNNQLDGKIFNATAFYNKKFKKTGRTFSVNLSGGINQSNAQGNLYSNINYYNENTGTTDSVKLIDQRRTNDLKSSKFLTNVTYTEPLSKALSLVLNYGISINNSDADRKSFSQSAPQDYNVLIDSLSSDYKFNQLSNQIGAMFNLIKGKHTLNFGARVADVRFKQVATLTMGGSPIAR